MPTYSSVTEVNEITVLLEMPSTVLELHWC